ncbi:MAG: SAM-dependent methyltransferase [Cyanobacteria bacterium RYN_339]|nr:SAM-dependent methyltransferase [Cyanobacteria bacterium RYN_339]
MEPTILPAGVGATAIAIAAAREAEGRRPDRLFEDPLAGLFLAAAGRPTIDTVGVLVDYVAVRTAFFDDYLLAAVAGGCRQVVVLASGLDGRAFRLDWPAGMRVFELDLPASLAFKERVLAASGLAPRCDRRVVPADLCADWGAILVAAGFTPGQPTAWLAEGIMSYLSEADREQLMTTMALLSAPGSRFALESAGALLLRSPNPEGDNGLAAFAQEYRGLWHSTLPTEPTAWLERHGWRADVQAPATVWRRHARPEPSLFAAGRAEGQGAWFMTASR